MNDQITEAEAVLLEIVQIFAGRPTPQHRAYFQGLGWDVSMGVAHSHQKSLRKELERVAQAVEKSTIAGTDQQRADLDEELTAATERVASEVPDLRAKAQSMLDEAAKIESEQAQLQRRRDQCTAALSALRTLVPTEISEQVLQELNDLRNSPLGQSLRRAQNRREVCQAVMDMTPGSREMMLHCEAVSIGDPSHLVAIVGGRVSHDGWHQYRDNCGHELSALDEEIESLQAQFNKAEQAISGKLDSMQSFYIKGGA